MIYKILLAQWATLPPSLIMQSFPAVQAIHLRQRLKWLNTVPALLRSGREQSTLGALYFQTHDWDRAVQHYSQAMRAFYAARDIVALGTTLSQLSVVFAQRQQYRWAIDYAQQAVQYLSETDDLSAYAAALHNLGMAYYHRGRQSFALSVFKQAIALRRCLDDAVGEGLTQGCMGRVQAAMGQHREALSSYQTALDLYHQHSARFEGCWYEITMRRRMGAVTSQLGDVDSAIAHYRTALCLSRDTHSAATADILQALGQCYETRNQPTPALTCYRQAQQARLAVGADQRQTQASSSHLLGLYY